MFKGKFFNKLLCMSQFILRHNRRMISQKKFLKNFIQYQPDIQELAHLIPSTYISVTAKYNNDRLYLICKNNAKIIAKHILASVDLSKSQVIAETNAGLGLVSTELLEGGVNRVRMYEKCKEFLSNLQKFNEKYPERIEIFPENFFDLNSVARKDQYEGSSNVNFLFKDVPRRAWIEDPVLTIVGTMPNLELIAYLLKCLVYQSSPTSYGRIQMFAILKPKYYKVLSASKDESSRVYKHSTILFNLFFDFELLDKFSRSIFLPWEKYTKRKNSVEDFDATKMYLVKINFKKDFPVPAEHFLPLYQFVRQLYGRGNKPIIPLMEKFVPGSGLNVIVPSMKHENFPEINIFTKFNELTPQQILAIFKELVNHPNYQGSPFCAMIENAVLSFSTTDSSNIEMMEESDETFKTEEKFEFLEEDEESLRKK